MSWVAALLLVFFGMAVAGLLIWVLDVIRDMDNLQ